MMLNENDHGAIKDEPAYFKSQYSAKKKKNDALYLMKIEKNLLCLNFCFKITMKVNLNSLLTNEEIKFLHFKEFSFEGCHHYSSRDFSRN